MPADNNVTGESENQVRFVGHDMSRKTPSQTAPDSPEYVEKWARELIAAVGKRQAHAILEGYRALSEKPKLAKYDRAVAKQRAIILSSLL